MRNPHIFLAFSFPPRIMSRKGDATLWTVKVELGWL